MRPSQNRSCRPHTGLAVLPVYAVVASLVPAAGHRSRLAQRAPLSPPRALLAAPRHLHAVSSGHKSKHCALAACGPGSSAIARASGHRSQHGGRLGDGPTVRRRDALQRPARARSSSSAGREGRACRKINLFVCLFVVCIDDKPPGRRPHPLRVRLGSPARRGATTDWTGGPLTGPSRVTPASHDSRKKNSIIKTKILTIVNSILFLIVLFCSVLEFRPVPTPPTPLFQGAPDLSMCCKAKRKSQSCY